MLTPEQIKSAVRVSDVVGAVVELKKAGAEFKACCPFHQEKTPSFTVNDEKGIWHCFGCGKTGDVIDFVREREGVPFARAMELLAERVGQSPTPQRRQRAKADPDVIVMPVPADAPAVTFEHRRLGTPSRVWTYLDAAGRVNGYVCRFDTETTQADGATVRGKEVLPRHFSTPRGWIWGAAPKPRPLYGLEILAARPRAGVVVVEGEKACDAARQLLPDQAVVTWPGGCGAVKHADWSPLAGRKVVIWPDCDRKAYKAPDPRAGQEMPPLEQPGMLAALEIAAVLRGLRCSVRVVEVFR